MHTTVLLNEAVEALNIKPNGIYIDATFGRGGHSQAILERLGDDGRLLAVDKDPEAKTAAAPFLSDSRFEIVANDFSNLAQIAKDRHWLGCVNGILIDLGVSSPQLDDAKRGFSFLRDGPLDMRMNPHQGLSAMQWLNSATQNDIANVIYQYGEERFSRRIASAIVRAREIEPLKTTLQLAKLVEQAIPKKDKFKHPATRTFQAIRIFINNELNALTDCLKQSLDVLAIQGRLVVITFHSLEDRIVKQFIQKESHGDDFPIDLPVMQKDLNHRLKKHGKGITPSQSEIDRNPRARSARLRIATRIA